MKWLAWLGWEKLTNRFSDGLKVWSDWCFAWLSDWLTNTDMNDGLADSATDWLTNIDLNDGLTDSVTDWPTLIWTMIWLTQWPTDWPTNTDLNDGLADPVTEWLTNTDLTDGLPDSVTDWLTTRLIVWMAYYQSVGLCGRLTVLTYWLTNWPAKWN